MAQAEGLGSYQKPVWHKMDLSKALYPSSSFNP